MSRLVVESRPDAVCGAVPVRFGPPGGKLQTVEAVIDWWSGEGHRYFRIRAGDGSEVILRHDLDEDEWRLDFFRRDAPA